MILNTYTFKFISKLREDVFFYKMLTAGATCKTDGHCVII